MSKKIKNYSWTPEQEVTVKLTGGQIDYLQNMSRMYLPLFNISDSIISQMIKNGDALPVYDENSVDSIIQNNPPGLVNANGEAISSETNKTEDTAPTKAPTLEVVK